MAKRELRERNEFSCMWGLSSIIESCQGCPSHKLISDGRPQKKQIIDCPRKLEQITSFDEECRKIQNEVQLAIKREQNGKMDSEFVDFLAKAHKRAMKKSRKASLTDELPSTSDEISLNKLKLAAMLEASECFQRSIRLGTYGHVDETNMQMSAKAFVDQIFIKRRLICNEGTTSESKSFSEALKVLNSDKNLFLKLLPDPNSLLEKCSKNSSVRGSEKPGTQLAMLKGKSNKNSGKKTDYQPSDRIVILKPVPQNAKHSENITCHCSSMQFQRNTSKKVSDAKPTSFSFREMKRKLKHTFGGTSDKVSNNGSTLKIGDDYNCHGVDIMSSCSSSTDAKRKEKLCKKQDLRFMKSSNVDCMTGTVRKKLDVSSARLSKKREFDVILEAKRHLSARLKSVNSVKTVTSVTSPKTLERILSSPEHNIWPLSPRKDGRYCSPDTSTRANESNGRIANGGRSSCASPLRPNTEVTTCEDYDKYQDTKMSSLIQTTVEEAHDTDSSMTDEMKTNGESKTVKVNSILQPELHISEAPTGRNSTNVTKAIRRTETNELHKDDDESVTHSLLDTLSENEAFTSSVDDFPSTPLSMKYQEEHRSPVSVLEPFFTEDENSPPSITHQTAQQTLQPLRLDFEECSFESFPQNQPKPSIEEEQDHLSQYVDLILESACLTWDQLSEISSLPDELLDSSVLDEVEFLFTDCYFDPKLLFDHINEVLLEIYQSHFCSPAWLVSVKPRIRHSPLAELVVDEIMTQAEFYLLPRTERRTLDQLVSKDLAECRSWLDVRHDTERIVIDISEDILEESILEILLEFHT